MKKRICNTILSGLLLLSALSGTATAADVTDSIGDPADEELTEAEYREDLVGTVTFDNLSRRMREGSLQILALQESIDDLEEIDYDKLKEQLRRRLNEIASAQWMMVQFGQSGTLAYEQMDQAYAAVREQFDAIKDGELQEDNADNIRQLRSLQNRIVVAGEATYIALSAKTYADARKEYNSHGGEYGLTYKANNRSYQQARHNYYAAKYTYDKKVQDFELELRNLYLKTLDHQQIRQTTQAALSTELENCAAARMKYSQGFLPENALHTAEDKAAQAEEKLASAEYNLFSAYNAYRWAVDYGIL